MRLRAIPKVVYESGGGLMKRLLDVPTPEGLNASQGLISPQIIVDAAELGNDEGLVYGVVDYVNRVQQDARLMPGEYPEEASWAYCADYYLAQVNNGGHGQYAHNSRMGSRGLRDCRLGLEAMGATENLEIFDAFLKIMSADDDRAHGIREGSGFGDIDPEISDLDDRFFELGYTILERNAAWLRTLPILAPTPRADMAAAFASLREKNPQAQAREDAAKQAQEKFEAEDETYSAAHACCAQEGITFERLTAGSHVGDIGIEWGALTSDGLRYLRVIHGSGAEMRDKDRALKAMYFYATRGPYRLPVGDGARRAEILKRKQLPRAGSLDEISKILSLSLAEFTLIAAPDGKSAATLLSVAAYASNFQYIPRAAWSGFSRSQEHAEFRLVAANALWDLSVGEIQRTHPKVLEQDHTALAVFAAAGAISALAAAAVRLPTARQLTALQAEAPDDLKREQANIVQQLLEARTWWQSAIWRIGYDIEHQPEQKNVFLRPSSFKLAAKHLLKPDGPVTALQRTMRYFDREYEGARSLNFAALVKSALTHIESQDYKLVPCIRAFQAGAKSTKPLPDIRVTFRVATPKSINGASKFPLMVAISAIDPWSTADRGALGFDIENSGKRRAFKPKG